MHPSIYETIAEELSEELKRELTGRDNGDVFHLANIERYYPVGCIFPEPSDIIVNNRPTSCGLSVNLEAEIDVTLEVKISGHYYVRRRPTLNEQIEQIARSKNIDKKDVALELKGGQRIALPYCWVYVPFDVIFQVAYGQSKKVINCTAQLQAAWKKQGKKTPIPCNVTNKSIGITEGIANDWSNEADYSRWLDCSFPDPSHSPDEYPTHVLEVEYEWRDGWLKIFAINRSKTDKSIDRATLLLDQNIYSIDFEIAIPSGVKVKSLDNVVEDSFEAPALVRSWGEGRNLQISFDGTKLHAEPIGMIHAKRIKPYGSLGGTELSFNRLKNDPLSIAENVRSYLIGYLNKYKSEHSHMQTQQSKDAVIKMENIIDRFSRGLDLLKTDSNMLEAFRLMNETFSRRYICETEIQAWRGFQFVYIVGKLPNIISREEDIFDVIFVSTGGGKTETYFGFIITTMFYLRLTGVKFGTVAIVKFPLRMLAIDQIQRIAPLIALADMVRLEHPKLGNSGNEPKWLQEFSLGFMIGGSSSRATPNRVNDDQRTDDNGVPKEIIDLHHLLDEHPEDAKLFFECPVCRYNEHVKGHKCEKKYDTVTARYDDAEIRGKHQCSTCGSRFGVHWTDEEVFRYLPTVIISTQDRIAYLAFAPYTRALFGAPLYFCPQHGFSIYSNACTPFKENGGYGKKGGTCKILKNNGLLEEVIVDGAERSVRFIVQDEMHLLRSDLGALDAPFERMVSGGIFHYCKVRPQYIGMSATVQGVQRQVKELYGTNKEVWLYPGDPPIDLNSSKQTDAFFEHTDDLHRIFLGCMPSIGDPSVVVQRAFDVTTEKIARFEQLVTTDPSQLPASLREHKQDNIEKALCQYRVNLGFMNAKVDLERSVQNLINITNVERAKKSRVFGVPLQQLSVKELTGDNSINDIRQVIDRVKAMSGKAPTQRLDILLATNLVSHGIDLKEMNIMVFYAIPGSTSEYIQALSRVGRTYPGIILVVHHPNRARDRGLWRTFSQYHMALRQQVENMPVDHLAPGLEEQTFVTLLRCYWNLIAEPKLFKGTRSLYKLRDIVDTASGSDRRALTHDACSEIIKWYEWNPCKTRDLTNRAEDYLAALKRYHDTLMRGSFDDQMKIHRPPPMYRELHTQIGNNAHKWMTTMTGIRGIQEGLVEDFDRFTKIYLKEMEQ